MVPTAMFTSVATIFWLTIVAFATQMSTAVFPAAVVVVNSDEVDESDAGVEGRIF